MNVGLKTINTINTYNLSIGYFIIAYAGGIDAISPESSCMLLIQFVNLQYGF